jgi:hypothetical protein
MVQGGNSERITLKWRRARKYFAPVSILILVLAGVFAFVNQQHAYSGPPPILDPDFKLWRNDSRGQRLMVWNSESVKGVNDLAVMNVSSIMGRDAVALGIFQSGAGSRWVYESLSQTLDGSRLLSLLNMSIGIWILREPCRCDANPFNKTSVVLSVEVNDGVHTISFVFSDQLQGTQTLLGHRIVFMPTPSGVWTYQKFNIAREYAGSHWSAPDQLTFSIVFGVGGSAVGWHYAYLNTVTAVNDGFRYPLPPKFSGFWSFTTSNNHVIIT